MRILAWFEPSPRETGLYEALWGVAEMKRRVGVPPSTVWTARECAP